MTGAAVTVRNVSKRFASEQALASVTLEVADGESVVILGPSGCGKTTLLRLIAGLETPDSGEIWLHESQVAGPRRNLRPSYGREIGFVFQDLALWPHLRVSEHLAFVLEAQTVQPAQRRQQIDDVLRLVRIDGFASRFPHELSGGEQQRVALARALVGRPRLLLLDEPFSSLDQELRGVLRTELVRVQRTLALTTIAVTHDREDAAALADRVVQMRSGRIVAAILTARTEDRS